MLIKYTPFKLYVFTPVVIPNKLFNQKLLSWKSTATIAKCIV